MKRLASTLLLLWICANPSWMVFSVANALAVPKPSANQKASSYPRFLVHTFDKRDASPLIPDLSTLMDPRGDHKVVPLYNLYWETRPLIGGPSWLPLHVRVVLQQMDSKKRHVWDFIPLDATNPATLQRLATFQSTPGTIRYNTQPISDIPANDTTMLLNDSGVIDQGFDPLLAKAKNCGQSYPDCNLHLLSNNCWTFAWRLTESLKELDSASSSTLPSSTLKRSNHN